MKSPIVKGMSILFICMILALIGSKIYFDQQVGPVNGNSQENIMVEIPKGASTAKIADVLEENKVIKSSMAFRILCKISKVDGKMQAGKYLFGDYMTAREIIALLVKGEVIKDTVKFTIPEGFELKQIADKLESLGIIDRDRFLEVADHGDYDYKFLKDIPKSKNRLEGFLFPDTYEVSKDAIEEEIIYKMLNRFDQIFKDEYYDRAKSLDMSVNEVITLASIIEREAKVEKERPLVSSVFHNRIKRGMLLQSCATVQYVLGERKENLSYQDIAIDSPYNTYKFEGLPPKPIASPGKQSIEAALYPAETEYLFFVVSKNGEHNFSKTYEEHLKAKNGN